MTTTEFVAWAPAWVQAFGALGTIYGAFAVVRKQAKAQRELDLQRELREERRRIQGIAQVAAIAVGLWKGAHPIMFRGDVREAQSLLAAVSDLRQLLIGAASVDLPARAIELIHAQLTSTGQMLLIAPDLERRTNVPSEVQHAVGDLATASAEWASALQKWCALRLLDLDDPHIKAASANTDWL